MVDHHTFNMRIQVQALAQAYYLYKDNISYIGDIYAYIIGYIVIIIVKNDNKYAEKKLQGEKEEVVEVDKEELKK